MEQPSEHPDPYQLETVARACEVLMALEGAGPLRLTDIADRTGLNRTIVFRLVHTLESRGFVRRIAGRQYQSNVTRLASRTFKLGFAAQSLAAPFSAALAEGLRFAAARERVDLVILDNAENARTVLRNAQRLIAEQVDLAIEHQTFERLVPAVTAQFREAGIPLIAIDMPHPGATYFGADGYRAGLAAGRVLGHWARRNWKGALEEVLLLGWEGAGPAPQLRLTGIETGVQEILRGVAPGGFVHLDCGGRFGRALEQVRRHLRRTPERRTLIGGVNDWAVLGALRAFEEAGRGFSCVGVGLGAGPEARAELLAPHTRLAGSVAFFPERYGADLVRLALDILHQRPVPPAVHPRHHLITAENLRQFYPAEGGPLTPRGDSRTAVPS